MEEIGNKGILFVTKILWLPSHDEFTQIQNHRGDSKFNSLYVQIEKVYVTTTTNKLIHITESRNKLAYYMF